MSIRQSFVREATYIAAIARTLKAMRAIKPDSSRTIADIIEETALRAPANVAILFEDRVISYAELNEGANRFAHWAHDQGIGHGDVVAILTGNRPEFLMAWLGLFRLGATAALLNTNLRGHPLAHSIALAAPRHLIVEAEFAAQYGEAKPALEHTPLVWSLDGAIEDAADLGAAIGSAPTTAIDRSWRGKLALKDRAFYIYTSGTTGLPKAANISHARMLYMMTGFWGALDAKKTDRTYQVLPLYHSAGGIAGLGPAFLAGGSLVLRRKFSVHEFWNDCFRYQPTLFQYIGELCRYLLNAPPSPHERDHSLRAAIGNGLRPEIWPRFQARFAIPKIVEFYGATEGNVSFLNYDGKVGAVGRLPWYVRKILKTRIVRFDVERELPIRAAEGFCIECADNEVGEAIGEIVDAPGRSFEGYSTASDSKKKVLNDVFKKGDSWFRTGDLMRRDSEGYLYFVDRIGDTFRWKGENVATSEVAEVLATFSGIIEENVFGVKIPGMDGRAGMAALVVEPSFDIAALADVLSRNLPAYARPLFIRIQPLIEITGTFKQRKVDLVAEGFDPEKIAVPLYWLNSESSRYEPLTKEVYDSIVQGRVKF